MADLPRMDNRQFRRAKRLICRLCANYDNGNCLPLDDGDSCPCPQLMTQVLICKYFRAAVLPADRELWAEIMREKPVKPHLRRSHCRPLQRGEILPWLRPPGTPEERRGAETEPAPGLRN